MHARNALIGYFYKIGKFEHLIVVHIVAAVSCSMQMFVGKR